jgi:hypothetical protein
VSNHALAEIQYEPAESDRVAIFAMEVVTVPELLNVE